MALKQTNMTNQQINITLVATPHCGNCAIVKEILEKLKPEFEGLNVQEIDATTPDGQELVVKYGIMASPGIIINGELFSMGGSTEKELKDKLKIVL